MTTFAREELMAAWGRKLQETRVNNGFSRQFVADVTGLTTATVYRIEKGMRFPSERSKQLLAGALRVGVGDLFPYSPTPPPFPSSEVAA